jgi:hypothetical protein
MSAPVSSYSIPDPIDRLAAMLDQYKNTADMNEKISKLSEVLLVYVQSPDTPDAIKVLAKLKVVISPKIHHCIETEVFKQHFGKNPSQQVLTTLYRAIEAETTKAKLSSNLQLQKQVIRAKSIAREPLFTNAQERTELINQLFLFYKRGLLNDPQDIEWLDLLLQAPRYAEEVMKSPQIFVRNLSQENAALFLTAAADFEPRFFIDNFSFFLNELSLAETDELPPKLAKEVLVGLLRRVIERAPHLALNHFVEWYQLLTQFGLDKDQIWETFDHILEDSDLSFELMGPLNGLFNNILDRMAPIRHHEADLLGFFFDLNPDKMMVYTQLKSLKEKHPEVDTILGFRDHFREIPDSRVIKADPEIRALQQKSGHMWECVSRERVPEGGYLYRFRFKSEFTPPEKMLAKEAEIFPAIETDLKNISLVINELFPRERIQHLNRQLAEKKAWLEFSALGHEDDKPSSMDVEVMKSEVIQIEDEIREANFFLTFTTLVRQLGFRVDARGQHGSEIVLPDRQVLLQRYNELRKHYDLPEMRIIGSDGVASDIEFCHALVENDGLISEDKEFFHDMTQHVFPMLLKAVHGNEEYRSLRARDVQFIQSGIDQLRRASEELMKEKSDLLKPKERVFLKSQFCYLETILGATADILSNRVIRPGMPYDIITPDRILSADSWQRYFVKRYGREFSADHVRSALALINRAFPIDFS